MPGKPADESAAPGPEVPVTPGPSAVVPAPVAAPALPVNYASGSIWLIGREPFLVVAHWDFAPGQLAAMASEWGPGGWQLRLHRREVGGRLVTQRALPAASGEAFLPVIEAGARYVVELGYQLVGGRWFGVAMSAPVVTPEEIRPRSFEVGEFPISEPSRQWASVAAVAVGGGSPTAPSEDGGWLDLPPAPLKAESQGSEAWPAGTAPTEPGGTAPSYTWELHRRTWRLLEHGTPGASESIVEAVSELIREAGEIPGEAPGRVPVPGPLEAPGLENAEWGGGISSAALPLEAPTVGGGRGFWFQVNAELIVYGRTERDARVTIAGRPVVLREDGSFSFRFILPDGDYPLPVVAVSAAGDDGRRADLRFLRETVQSGEVGTHPQDPGLRPPVAEAIG